MNTTLFKTLVFWLFISAFFQLNGFAQSFDCEEELFSKKDKQTRLFGYVNALGEYRVPPTFLKAMPFIGKHAVVQQGKKFGVINCEGILVVPADYDEIAAFSNGKGWVKRGGLWGLVDLKGRLLIQPMYEEVKEINAYSGTVTWVKKQGLWGLISKENGRFLVNPAYEDVSSLSDSAGIGRKLSSQDLVYYGDGRVIIQGMRKVKKVNRNLFIYQSAEQKWGMFNSLAFILIRPENQSVQYNPPFIQVQKEGKSGLRNLRGQEVTPNRFDEIMPFTEGFAAVREGKNWNVLNTRGQFLFTESLEFAQVLSHPTVLIRKSGQWGLYQPEIKTWLLEANWHKMAISSDENWLALSRQPNSGHQFYGIRSQQLETERWDSLSLSDPIASVRAYSAGKIRMLVQGKPGLESYLQAFPAGRTSFRVQTESGWGIWTATNPNLLSATWDAIAPFRIRGEVNYVARKSGQMAWILGTGQIRGTFQGEELLPCQDDQFLLRQKGKWGLVDLKGNVLLELKYDSIQAPVRLEDEIRFPVVAWRKGKGALAGPKGILGEESNGVWMAAGDGLWYRKEKGQYRLMSSQGKELGENLFEEVRPFSEGNGEVRLEGKWGFLNSTGRLVIPARFEEVLPYRNGIAFARENGKWGVLRKNGSWLVKPIGTGVELDEDGKRRLILP